MANVVKCTIPPKTFYISLFKGRCKGTKAYKRIKTEAWLVVKRLTTELDSFFLLWTDSCIPHVNLYFVKLWKYMGLTITIWRTETNYILDSTSWPSKRCIYIILDIKTIDDLIKRVFSFIWWENGRRHPIPKRDYL